MPRGKPGRIGLRIALALLATVSTVALAACGGSGSTESSGSIPDGASFAPDTSPAFVDINTDVNGQQWQQADALLNKFPARSKLLDSITSDFEKNGLTWEQDIKPALGSAIYVVWLDLQRSGDDVVGYTKPADQAAFDNLLDKQTDPKLVHRQIDGWTVFAETEALLDRFQNAQSGGSLADDSSFQDAFSSFPDQTLVRAWVNGQDVQQRLDQSLSSSGSDSLTQSFGKLESLSAALAAQQSGVLLAADVAASGGPSIHDFTPELPKSVPSGALAYISVGDLRDTLKRGLAAIENSDPSFAQQRAAVEAALGVSLENDVFPLFDNETGFAIYGGTSSMPGFALYVRVDDEDKARKLIDSVGALAQLGSSATTKTLTVEGTEVREIDFPSDNLTIYAAVSNGVAVVTNSEAVLKDTLDGGPTLSDDSAFTSAESAAKVPDSITGLVYVDIAGSVTAYYDAEHEAIPKDVHDNLAPLRSAVIYGEQDGDNQKISGFLQIQ